SGACAPDMGWGHHDLPALFVQVVPVGNQSRSHASQHRKHAAMSEPGGRSCFGFVGHVVTRRASDQIEMSLCETIARPQQRVRIGIKVTTTRSQAEPWQRRPEARVMAEASKPDRGIGFYA